MTIYVCIDCGTAYDCVVPMEICYACGSKAQMRSCQDAYDDDDMPCEHEFIEMGSGVAQCILCGQIED